MWRHDAGDDRAGRDSAEAEAEAQVISYVSALLQAAGFAVSTDGDLVHADRDGMRWECAPSLLPSIEEADRMAAAIISGWERRIAQRESEAARMVPRWE